MRITLSATGSLALIASALVVVSAAAPAFAEGGSGVNVQDRDISVGSYDLSAGLQHRALLHSGTAGPADATGHTVCPRLTIAARVSRARHTPMIT